MLFRLHHEMGDGVSLAAFLDHILDQKPGERLMVNFHLSKLENDQDFGGGIGSNDKFGTQTYSEHS